MVPPRQHEGEIDPVDQAIVRYITLATLARSPIAQHDCEIGPSDDAVMVEVGIAGRLCDARRGGHKPEAEREEAIELHGFLATRKPTTLYE
jgi:hypothetical protein